MVVNGGFARSYQPAGPDAKLRPMQFDLQRALAGQKAIPAHPALMSGDPITTYSPGANNPREDAKISQAEAMRHLDAYGGHQAIDWLSDCVNLYSDTASTAKWYLEKNGKKLVRDKRPGDPKGAEVAPPDLIRLLDAPNPYMDYIELIELLVIDLLLVGNAYWFKWRTTSDGKPLALYRLAPPYVKIVPGPFGPKRYEYQPPNAKQPLKIDPTQIIHFRRPNPHSAHYGLGIVQGGGRPFDLELALTDTMASYYENKADPSLIVQSERRVPRDVFNKLRAQLRNRISGSRRSGELLVLEAGLKATSISATARDALFDTLTKMSRDRIFAMFRASPMLFGLMDEATGANKISDARREFDTRVMRPFLDKLQARVSAGLCAAWGVEFKIDYNYIMAPEDLVKLSGELAKIPGVKVRDIRRFLAPVGIEESTGDEKIDETVLNLPGENLDANGQPINGGAGFADRNLPGEPGRPPLGKNTKNFPAGAQAKVPAGKALTINDAIERLRIIETKAVENSTAQRDANRLSGEQRPQDTLVGSRTREVDNVVSYIHNNLGDAAHVLERGLLDHVEGKAFNPSNLKQRIKRSESWKSFMSMVGGVLEAGAQRAISAAALHQGSTGRTPEADLDYEAIARRVVYRKDGVESISRNLRDEIVQKVGKSLDEGADRAAVERVIRESIDFWRTSQAETIALTEAVHAYNEGTLTVAEELGIDEVVVEDGTDHDEPCKEADGAVWTIEHAREHRLEHPRCRRAFTPLN